MRVIGERNGDRRERRESAMRWGREEGACHSGRKGTRGEGARTVPGPPHQLDGRATEGKKFLLPYMTTGVSNNHTACLLGHSYSQK